MSIFSKELCFSLKPLLRLAGLVSPQDLVVFAAVWNICVAMEAKPLLQPAQGQHIPAVPYPQALEMEFPFSRSHSIQIRISSHSLSVNLNTETNSAFFTCKRRSFGCLFSPLFFRKQQLNSALWVEKEVCENMAYGCLPENCASCLLREIVMCSWHSL